MSTIEKVLTRIDAGLDEASGRLIDWLKIPSISTDSRYADDMRRAAAWLVEDLKTLGFEAEPRETGGHPVVYARSPSRPGKKRVLFYGHYDVQPVDPLSAWKNPPFEAKIATLPDGRQAFLGRGSSDDKGQTRTFLEALRAFKAETGEFPVDVTVLVEGAEEDGSKFLPEYVEAHKDELAADVALVCDTGRWNEDTPCITTSLRGLLYTEIVVHCANRDLHSGHYGGSAQNPIHVLARIIADLHDDNGAVTIPHFYDGVPETPPDILEQWKRIGMTPESYLGPIGLKYPSGEKDRMLIELMQSRPCCDANGIIGGYTGEGTKTVIAAEARAKVSMRLVGDQDPEKIAANFEAFIRERIPADCSYELIVHKGSRAVALPYDMPELALAREALKEEWTREPVVIGIGGSIGIIGSFRYVLGLNVLLVGWALEDDCIHSPNEKYDVRSFHKGMRSWARILERLGG
ncbi:MAG: M20/M25/M40 family metallo-hydrolase [Methylobacteriaceae bacterium]|jgi:acetylornithine deacetylase/succinyl-diaminopimelate desuccinylase-like protein|nr:M20/M25/M40 family metallo-hydrolase [Methylobacteriaceae bacterium]